MNTRVFKDISKYQHRAWLGFTTRQIIFVLPAFIVTIIVLGLNLFFWQFGDWFVYGFVFAFTIPLMLFGVYKPNDLYFEHYLKYRLHFELTVPLRTITGKKGPEHEKKIHIDLLSRECQEKMPSEIIDSIEQTNIDWSIMEDAKELAKKEFIITNYENFCTELFDLTDILKELEHRLMYYVKNNLKTKSFTDLKS